MKTVACCLSQRIKDSVSVICSVDTIHSCDLMRPALGSEVSFSQASEPRLVIRKTYEKFLKAVYKIPDKYSPNCHSPQTQENKLS